MVENGVIFCGLVARSFAGYNMEELRAIELSDVTERSDQYVEIMAINGADVVETKLFKQGAWCHHPLHMLFSSFCEFQHRRYYPQHLLARPSCC